MLLRIIAVCAGIGAAIAAVAMLVSAVNRGTALPATLPQQTANWYYDRPCGLPEQDFNTVAMDVQQAQQAYAATALNLPDYAVQLRADAQAAAHCQPTRMRAADRSRYSAALFQAATAAKAAKTDPYAMGSHLDTAASLLASVAQRTGAAQ